MDGRLVVNPIATSASIALATSQPRVVERAASSEHTDYYRASTRCQMSNVKCQMPDARCQSPSLRDTNGMQSPHLPFPADSRQPTRAATMQPCNHTPHHTTQPRTTHHAPSSVPSLVSQNKYDIAVTHSFQRFELRIRIRIYYIQALSTYRTQLQFILGNIPCVGQPGSQVPRHLPLCRTALSSRRMGPSLTFLPPFGYAN